MLTEDLLSAIVFLLIASLVLVPALLIQRPGLARTWQRTMRFGDQPGIW